MSGSASAAPTAARTAFDWAAAPAADLELARRTVAELGVEQSAGPVDPPGWLGYAVHLGNSVAAAVVEGLGRAVGALPLPPGWPRALAVGLTAVALVAALVLAVRALLARHRRRRGGEAPEATKVVAPGTPEAGAARDAAAWRGEFERLLAAGRTAEALEALWWWLARSLVPTAGGDAANGSWTGRELVTLSGRRDLLPLVRSLEAATYGRRPVDAAEVGRLASGLSRGLAAGKGPAR